MRWICFGYVSFAMILPKHSVAFVVDSTYCHPCIMTVVQMHRPFKETGGEEFSVYPLVQNLVARITTKQLPAVAALTILLFYVLLSGLLSNAPVRFFIIDRQFHNAPVPVHPISPAAHTKSRSLPLSGLHACLRSGPAHPNTRL